MRLSLFPAGYHCQRLSPPRISDTPCLKHLNFVLSSSKIWDKVFKNGPSKIFKGCLAQILLGPFLNTLSHILHSRVIQSPEGSKSSKNCYQDVTICFNVVIFFIMFFLWSKFHQPSLVLELHTITLTYKEFLRK